MNKKEAIKIISEAACSYHRNLEALNILFIYKDRERNSIEYFETIFRDNNFQHLTGIDMIDEKGEKIKNSRLFYAKALNGKLAEREIQFRNDGTTELKLKIIKEVANLTENAKMTGLYQGGSIHLTIDRLVGSIHFCIGFIKVGSYYIPNTCLLEDLRNISSDASQILAILSKPIQSKDNKYGQIRYLAKGFDLHKGCENNKKLKEIVEL